MDLHKEKLKEYTNILQNEVFFIKIWRMRILHCCLANFYVDNYGYQENILPKMHKLQGHEVYILASTETFPDNVKLGYVSPSTYETRDGIPITRVPYVKWLPHFIAKKLRVYKGVLNILKLFKPDIIFLHNAYFLSIYLIVKYVKKNNHVKIYVDSHADSNNSARGWISRNILHRLIYRFCIKKIEPYTTKLYGTLPFRNDFLIEFYKVSPHKVELLPMGVDLTDIDVTKRNDIKKHIRQELGLAEEDFIVVSGGKIDVKKNIHLLISAVAQLKEKDIKLVLFGTISPDIKSEIEPLLSFENKIKYIGWVDSLDTAKYLLSGDVAIFPGSHSVLWEQTVGLGIPAIFKKMKGFYHIDIGGNCMLLDNVSIESIKDAISYLYHNRDILKNMQDVVESKGPNIFSYYEIAKKAIEQ